ncbi:MAG: site-specific integrase [Anaerolineae bacterium]|nr:site-specific integrase [Anaerolineae bacterium]
MNPRTALTKFLDLPRRVATEETYRDVLERHIRFLGPDRDVTAITQDDIAAWHRDLLRQDTRYAGHSKRPKEDGGLSDWTLYKHLKTARVFWNWLERAGHIARSPMAGYPVHKPPKPPVSQRAAPLDTLLALVPAMRRSPQEWAMFCFLLDTGVRAGGLCSLSFGGLDLKRRVAVVTEKQGRRHTAVFGPVTAAALRAWLKERGDGGREIFLNRDGNPWTPAALRSWLRRRCHDAGVKPIGPHALRRAVGCFMALMHVPLSLLQRHLGHTSPVITAIHYMPDADDDLRHAVEQQGLLRALLDEGGDVEDQAAAEDAAEGEDEDEDGEKEVKIV